MRILVGKIKGNDEFGWRLVSNGRVVAVSPVGYNRKSDAVRGAYRFRNKVENAVVEWYNSETLPDSIPVVE